MKVTLNWLKQYVDFNWSPEELTERLTMLGLEVEGVVKLGGEFAGIVVAQVVTRDKALVARLQRTIRALIQPEHRALKHWAKHHLPGYKE